MRIILLQLYSQRPTPAYDHLAAAFRRKGHSVLVGSPTASAQVTFSEGKESRLSANSNSLSRAEVTTNSKADSRLLPLRLQPAIVRLAKVLRNHRPDVIQIVYMPGLWFLPRMNVGSASVFLDVRQAGYNHSNSLRSKVSELRSRWLIRNYSLAGYRSVTFLNEDGAKWAFGEHWSAHCHVVPLGVPREFLESPLPVLRSSSVVEFIYVGTLARCRRLETILGAAKRLLGKTPPFRITLVGPDETGGYYSDLAFRSGLCETVFFEKGIPPEQLMRRIQEADVALAYIPLTPVYIRQPSLKVLEYQALGMPIIGTVSPHNKVLILEGETGLLVRDSPDALAQAIAKVLQDPALLNRLQRNAASLRGGHTWDDIVELYLTTVYRKAAITGSTAARCAPCS